MARQRKLSPERKAFISSLIEHYHPEDAADVQEMQKRARDPATKKSAQKKALFRSLMGSEIGLFIMQFY